MSPEGSPEGLSISLSPHATPERVEAAETIKLIAEHFMTEYFENEDLIPLPHQEKVPGDQYLIIYDTRASHETTANTWLGYLRVIPSEEDLTLSYHDIVVNEYDEILYHQQELSLEDLFEETDEILEVSELMRTLQLSRDVINSSLSDIISFENWQRTLPDDILMPLLKSLSCLHKERVWGTCRVDMLTAQNGSLARETWAQDVLAGHIILLADRLIAARNKPEEFTLIAHKDERSDRLLRVNKPSGRDLAWIEQIDETLDESNDMNLFYHCFVIDETGKLWHYSERFTEKVIMNRLIESSAEEVYEQLRLDPRIVSGSHPGYERQKLLCPGTQLNAMDLLSSLMQLRSLSELEE